MSFCAFPTIQFLSMFLPLASPHDLLCSKNSFMKIVNWNPSLDCLKKPSRTRLRWPFRRYFIVSFWIVDQFDEFYRWQFAMKFRFLKTSETIVSLIVSFAIVETKIPFFSICFCSSINFYCKKSRRDRERMHVLDVSSAETHFTISKEQETSFSGFMNLMRS